jgi:uncharacterized protein (TIGR00369 family)
MRELRIRNADYAARVAASLASQPFMHTLLGARVTHVEPGVVEIECPCSPALLQPAGNVHGIVLTALADSATGYAAQTLMALAQDAVTVELKVNYLAPGIGETFLARGSVRRAGRTLTVCEGEVFAVTGATRTPVAFMLTTMMAVPAHA